MRHLMTVALLVCSMQGIAFDLQGHRGARGLAPENTLPGFAAALEVGVSTIETDVQLSRDGVLLISHDAALNPDITRDAEGRFLSGRGPVIADTGFAELRRYDVGRIRPGTRYAAEFPRQRGFDGARMPQLEELFALVRKTGNESVRFALEIKVTPTASGELPPSGRIVRATVDAVKAAGLESRTTIVSFDWGALQEVQRIAPEIGTGYLTIRQRQFDNIGTDTTAPSPWTAGFRYADHGSVPAMIRAAGGRVWSSFHGDLDAAQMREAHALGLTVLAWTVNEPKLIARMIDLGVDGLITDRPDLARIEMARRGMELPQGALIEPTPAVIHAPP